jgi:hypothetical protein
VDSRDVPEWVVSPKVDGPECPRLDSRDVREETVRE